MPQCQCATKTGARCTRQIKSGRYCAQHKDCKTPYAGLAEEKAPPKKTKPAAKRPASSSLRPGKAKSPPRPGKAKSPPRPGKAKSPESYLSRLPKDLVGMVENYRLAPNSQLLMHWLSDEGRMEDIESSTGAKKRQTFFNRIFDKYGLGLRLEGPYEGKLRTLVLRGELRRAVPTEAIVELLPYFLLNSELANKEMKRFGVNLRLVPVELEDDPETGRHRYEYEVLEGRPVVTYQKTDRIM